MIITAAAQIPKKYMKEKIETEIQWSIVMRSHIFYIHGLLIPVYTTQSLTEQ